MAQPARTPTRARFVPTAGVTAGGSGGEIVSGRLTCCAAASGVAGQQARGGSRNDAAGHGLGHRIATVIFCGCVSVSSKRPARQVGRRGPGVLVVDPLAGRFQNPPVRDGGGAGRLAGAAAQAQVEMPGHVGVLRRQRALVHLPHQHDPPARAVRLAARFQIGRAGRQAQAAVDAGHQVLFVLALVHNLPTNRPGFHIRVRVERLFQPGHQGEIRQQRRPDGHIQRAQCGRHPLDDETAAAAVGLVLQIGVEDAASQRPRARARNGPSSGPARHRRRPGP